MKLNKLNRDEYIRAFQVLMANYCHMVGDNGQVRINQEYIRYLPIAKHISAHIGDVYVKILDLFVDYHKVKDYAAKYTWSGYGNIFGILYDIRCYCYKDTLDPGNFMTLEEQNDAARHCPYFDFSMKKPKSLKDL